MARYPKRKNRWWCFNGRRISQNFGGCMPFLMAVADIHGKRQTWNDRAWKRACQTLSRLVHRNESRAKQADPATERIYSVCSKERLCGTCLLRSSRSDSSDQPVFDFGEKELTVMYIHPFVAGVLATILAEILFLFGWSIKEYQKRK